ncbi:MAG: hypothetical protein M5U10_03345 [Candidatus Methanoperedens sp.]|nr:hypothetical protein [Candidatus Methanoperedens sp.]
MDKKASVLIILIINTLIAQVDTVGAAYLTTNVDKVESLIGITDIVEKEWLKSVDSTKFDPLNGRDFNAQKDFLWSPDGSKLLILTQTYIKTKNASADDKKIAARCSPGPFGLHEQVSDLFLINADGSELINIARTETSIRTAKNNTASFIDSAVPVGWNSDGDKIVFGVWNPCDEYSVSFYVLDKNGSVLVELKGLAGITQWSPDRSKLAILDSKNSTRIYIIDVENSTVKQIPLGISAGYYHIAYSTAWGPDGEKIAFIGSKDGEIYTVNIHNYSVQQLTTTMAARGMSWKPDGKKIVFVAEDGLYVMDADGSNPTLIGKGNFYFRSWSPDGRKIVLTDINEKENSYKTYVLVINGRTIKLITPASGSGKYLEFVSWHPDGKKIILRETDGRYFDELYVFDIDSETTKQIVSASDSKVFNHISWSPNGDRIAFTSDSTNVYTIYTINQDGSDKVTLVERASKGFEGMYSWGLDNKIYSFTDDALIKVNPDGTERLSLVKNLPTNAYSSNKIYMSPDSSRMLLTVGSLDVNERYYLLKLKGYDEVMSVYTPVSIKQGDVALIEIKSMSKPVENAVISLNGRDIGKTDENGFLKYNFKEAGNFRLSAAKQGFRTVNNSIIVKEASPEPAVTITAPAPAVAENTPQTPGFSSIFAVLTFLLTIYQIKKRRIL